MLHKIIETVDTAARAVGKIARAADTAGGVFATMIAQPETVISVGEPQALDGDDAVAFAARLAQVEAERDAVRKIGDLAVSEADILRALVNDLEHQLAEAKREEKEARDLAVDAERNAKKAEGDAVASMEKATGVSFGSVEEAVNHVLALRERVKDLEAASPATQGQPVATDDELCTIGERAFMGAYSGSTVARYAAYKAVARHVRAERAERPERPACLVARAVALGCDVGATWHGIGGQDMWEAHVFDNVRDAAYGKANVHAADVPATLSRLLDEVEAARKAVPK